METRTHPLRLPLLTATLSMTWMTPLPAITSAAMTRASLMATEPPSTRIRKSPPCTVAAVSIVATSFAVTRPGTTW